MSRHPALSSKWTRDSQLLPVEFLARVFGVVDEELARSEALAIQFLEAVHLVDEFVGAEQIDEAEWTAELRRETKTKHGADVTLKLESKRSILSTENTL